MKKENRLCYKHLEQQYKRVYHCQTPSLQPPRNVSASNIKSSICLPMLQLSNFNGTVLKWPEFWDIYELSVHRQDIPKVVKYGYLKGVLRGSAVSVITGVSVTNEGCDVAIYLYIKV